jgi:hypothetical protein
VLILTDAVEEAELLRSRLTRQEVHRQLCILADTLSNLPPQTHAAMPEIDWAGWRGMRTALDGAGAPLDDALLFGVRSLAPATLSWLRVYRESQPALFQAWH